MDFGFAVAAGPLTQISVGLSGLKDVVTAAKYVVQLYDSYKGRDQGLLLEQSLASSKVSIPATSTFDSLAYLGSRQKYANTSGVAGHSSNALCRVLLRGTSTSAHGHPGLLCLRVLTTALLCFMQEGTIASVYQDVLPKYLLHCEQEEEQFVFEGPSLLSLKQYIHTISKEEEGDEYRRYLLQHVDNQVQRVTLSASTLTDLLASDYLEIGHIIGLISWVLTPVLDREVGIYRTRSLKIWCIALVLSKVAFEVEANCDAITTSPDHNVEDLVLHHFVSKPEVVLVLAPGWPTDIGWQSGKRDDEPLYVPVETPPRPMSVRAFPATATLGDAISLRHAKDACAFEAAFRGSYLFVRQQLSQDPRIRLVAGLQGPLPEHPSILLDPPRSGSVPAAEDLKLLQAFRAVFDPELLWPQEMIDSSVTPLMVPLFARYLLPWHKQHNELADGIGQSSQLMLNYIVFGSILAAVSLYIRSSECETDETGLDMQFVYQHPHWGASSGGSGLATCFTGVMTFLSHARSEDLGGDLCYAWKGLVLQVRTPLKLTVPIIFIASIVSGKLQADAEV
ncbi:hypothetical protein MMC30_000210 [Trapelia coarctata]|nr:hypothetical protein [Trapelia coarctata]